MNIEYKNSDVKPNDVKILKYLKTVSIFTLVASSIFILLTIMQSSVISYFIIRIKKITVKEEEEEEPNHTDKVLIKI